MSVTSLVAAVRSQVLGLLARRFAGAGPYGGLSMLPDTVLWPLHRDGLDPVAEIGRRRAEAPVSRLPVPFGIRLWLVTGYEPVREVLGSVDGFSNDFGRFAGRVGITVRQDPGGLGFADPPVHTRLRRALTPEFTRRRLARLQPRIEEIVHGRLDALGERGGPVDLWHEFALPVPALTICELLGVPYADRDYFQKLSTSRFDLAEGAGVSLDAIGESLAYLGDLITRQRRDPGDGLLGALIRTHGDEIDDRELAGLADGVLTGGLETSASMLALGALMVMADPALAGRLAGGPDEVGAAVDGRAVDVGHARQRPPDRRRRHPGRRRGGVLAERRQPGRARRIAPGVRVRAAPLHRRGTGPHGAAHGVPRPRPAVPGHAPRGGPGHAAVPPGVDRLRPGIAAGHAEPPGGRTRRAVRGQRSRTANVGLAASVRNARRLDAALLMLMSRSPNASFLVSK